MVRMPSCPKYVPPSIMEQRYSSPLADSPDLAPQATTPKHQLSPLLPPLPSTYTLRRRLPPKNTNQTHPMLIPPGKPTPKPTPEPNKNFQEVLLVVARKLTTSREILLWMTPSEAPKALQASECSELLDPMRASCWIFAQH